MNIDKYFFQNIIADSLEKIISTIKENIKKSTVERSDFLMKYQSILLEVNAYLTNTNIHKKIILHMCPELRIDQKLLESIKKKI